MDKKYFFFDIDGTLAAGVPGNQYIPESTKETLKKLRENGHFLAVATGRSYAMSVETMRNLGFENMVSDGGNGITINNELKGIKPLDYDLCIELIDECRDKGYIWAFSPDDKKRRLAPDNQFFEHTQDVYMETVTLENVNPRDYDKIYKVYIACFYPEEEKLETLKKLPYCRFHKEYLFVEPSDKSNGIKTMMDYFNADYKDVVVFGDAKNDLSMFRDDWLKIAMGNAIDELKELADYITDDVDKDGIYKACKHFGWI